jgi:hypothetical protein
LSSITEGAAQGAIPAEREGVSTVGTLARLAAWLDQGLFGALLLVIACSPFEAGYPPIGRFLNATFTNLELTLLLLGAAWALKLLVDPAARSRLLRLPLLWPFLALVAASVLSTLFGEYKALGVQATYRVFMGGVVMASVWESLRSTRRLLAALFTLIGVALLAAVLGLLEFAPWFDIEPMLAAFKPMPTTVAGALRLSGSFEYANGAAFYLEMVLPVALGLAVLFSSRRLTRSIEDWTIPERAQRALQLVLFIVCGVLAVALLLTLSRAALLGTGLALVVFALAALLRGRSPDSRFVRSLVLKSLGLAGITALIWAGIIYATQPVFRLRLTSENDRNWYNASYQPGEVPELAAGDWVTVPVTLRNDGPMVWQASGALPVHVSYHWLSDDKKTALVFEGARTPLPRDVGPGESVEVQATLLAPPKPGAYYLQWDLVHERVVWFSFKTGVASEATRHVVEASDSPTVPTHRRVPPSNMPAPVVVQGIPATDTVERGKLWQSALKMFLAHPLTGVGPDGFRNLRGQYENVTNWNRNIFTNNTYIEIFTNLGILGGLAFMWLGGLALWLALARVVRAPPDARWAISLGVGASLVAFFLHGFLDYFLFSTPLYVIFWLLIGVSSFTFDPPRLKLEP